MTAKKKNEMKTSGKSSPIEIQNPTVAEVNRAIRAAGGKEKLTAGRGYYYFRNVGPSDASSSMICIYRCSDVPLSRWMAELDEARKEQE